MMDMAMFIHNLYTPYGNKHSQNSKEEEAYTKKLFLHTIRG